MKILLETIPVICKDTGLEEYQALHLYFILEGVTRLSVVNKGKQYRHFFLDEECNVPNIKLIKEMFSRYEYKEGTIISDNILNVENWIETYRDLFTKANCNQAVPKGNKKDVICRMKWFIKQYPQYADIDLIINAAKLAINTIGSKFGTDRVPQADNMIVVENYKTAGGFPVSGKLYAPGTEKLVNYCEMVADMMKSGKEITTNNIKPNYIKNI